MKYRTLVSTIPSTQPVNQQDPEAETRLHSWIPRKPTRSADEIRSREGRIRCPTAPKVEHIRNDFDSKEVVSKLDTSRTPQASLVAAKVAQEVADMYFHTLGHLGRYLHWHPGEHHGSARDIRPSQDQAHSWQ